ncbi:hypothetical protein [Nesterenkonia populi]
MSTISEPAAPAQPQTRPEPELPSIPEIWEAPSQGTQWCDCGKDHPLTRDAVLRAASFLRGQQPEHLTHSQVCRITMELWNYVEVCPFFHMAVDDAACRCHGEKAERYPFETGLAIVKRFSDRWNGCPEEQLCRGGFGWEGPAA